MLYLTRCMDLTRPDGFCHWTVHLSLICALECAQKDTDEMKAEGMRSFDLTVFELRISHRPTPVIREDLQKILQDGIGDQVAHIVVC